MKGKLLIVLNAICLLGLAQLSYGQTNDLKCAPRSHECPSKCTEVTNKCQCCTKELTADGKTLHTIILDFGSLVNQKTEVLKVPKDISEGEYYRLQIDNINLNMFKVSVNAIDTILSKKQETPSFGSLKLDDLAKISGNIISNSGLIASIDSQGKKQDAETNYQSLKDDKKFEDEKLLKKDPILKRMAEEVVKQAPIQDLLTTISDHIDKLKLKIFSHRLGAENQPHKVDYNFDAGVKEKFDFKQSYNDLLVQIRSAQQALKEANGYLDTYQKFYKVHKDEIDKNTDYKEKDLLIKEVYAKQIAVLSEVVTTFTADKIIAVFSPLVSLDQNSCAVYRSLPFYYGGEQAKVRISITPRDESKLSQKYTSTLVFPGVIRTYVTAGISLYAATLYDESYIVNPLNEGGVKKFQIEREDPNKMEIGAAMLLKGGRKFGCKDFIGWHGQLGVGMSIASKTKPRVLFGGGLTFGRKHMLTLDVGGIAGYADRVNESVLKSSYDEVPTNVIYSKLKVGLFGGLGYIYQF